MNPRRLGSRRAALSLALCVCACLPACGTGADDPARDDGRVLASPTAGPTAERDAVVLQVSLFWGGGARRAWGGAVRLHSESVRIPWIWMTDFEDGDLYLAGPRFPPAVQDVPGGWLAPSPADFDRLPGNAHPRAMLGTAAASALVQTTTDGDADGLCIEVRGARDALLELDLGPGAQLSATLGALAAGPVVVAADEVGNVLLAQATNLERDAPPSAAHFDRTAHRVSLHTHSCFSTNEMLLEPVVQSLRPFVRTTWWTDHNIGNRKFVLAGDFEDRDLALEYWRASAESAFVIEAGLVPGAGESAQAYRLTARGAPDSGGRAWIALGRGAAQLNAALCTTPRLRWSWKPLQQNGSGASSVAYVLVQFASGREIRYLSGLPEASASGPNDLLLESPDDDWTAHERDLAADARELWGPAGTGGTDSFLRARYGVLCPPGATAGVLFDNLALDVPEPPEAIRIQEEVLRGVEGLRSYVGLEQTAWLGAEGFGPLIPHLTALVPTGAAELFRGADHPPSDAERTEFVASIQAAGGTAGTHHMQLDRHYAAFLDAQGFGSDLFELGGAWWFMPGYSTDAERRDRDAHGYPALEQDELFPLLVRWDRTTARGLLLSAYGAPDLHLRFERSSYGWLNRWLTSILADDDSPASLLQALRSGQAVATDWRTDALLSLSVNGQPWMGKFVATDRSRHTLQARVSGALPGSRLRWIRGELVRGVASTDAGEPAPPGPIGVAGEVVVDGATFEAELELDTARGVFVRAELLNPAGFLVAVSNPVVFAPYWPETWAPDRVGFDWRGVSLGRTSGLSLTDARVAMDGTLELLGSAHAADAQLVLAGAGVRLAGGSAGLVASTAGAPDELRLAGFTGGPFRVVLAFDTPWEPVPTADPLALPSRKQRFFTIEVGNPASEAGRELAGFGRHYQGPLLLDDAEGSYRSVEAAQPASFRLPIPAGTRVWIKLRSFGFSKAAGRLSMGGRELGSFTGMSARTFVIEPAEPGSDETLERTFEIHLEPLPELSGWTADRGPLPTWAGLQLQRIELWRGPGVVDY